MTGEPRRHRSKWDTREGPPDVVEISEDESPQKGGSKPDGFMHHGNGGHKQEHHDGVNKDMKDLQSKAPSERSQPSKLADEYDDKGWGKADLEKPHGNQGTSRYADDRRRVEGWGTALDRGYSSRMPSDPDPWRQRSLSPSPRGAWNRPRRNRSRSRSRSRNRSRSRSRSIGRGRGRSRSPYFVDRGPERRIERGRTSGGPLPCRDFVAGRCRRGLNCRFPHEDGGHRPFEEPYPAGPRERYGYQSKEFMDSREQDDFLPSRQSHSRYDDETWERSEPRRDYRSTELCYNFVKGRCSRGSSCRFSHDDPAPHGGWRDEARQSAYDRVGAESSYGNRIEHRRINKIPCKFFASGHCRRGSSCPYLHEEASQSQMGLSARDEPSNYNDGPTGRGNFSKWGEQNNGTHTTSQNASRDGWETPVSQSTGRNGSRYEYENRHPQDTGKSQYQINPQEDFGSQVHKSEVAASQQPQLLTPVQATADSMNNDKVSGADQNALRSAGNLSMHTGLHAGSAAENLGPNLQSQDTISQIHGPPTLPIPTHLQNNTSSLPSNNHMQQSNFSVHPQDQFSVTHTGANNSVHNNNVQGQPVAPHMGTTQPVYGLEPQALPNLSAHNGHGFSVSGQVAQDLSTSVHTGQSQAAAIDLHRLGQEMGGVAQAPSTQNMQNFQPAVPNVQIQNQSSQGLPHVPASSSADMVGAPVSLDAAAKNVAASLAQYFGNAGLSAGTVGLQPSEPNASSSLMVTSSAAPSAVQPNSWPWAQQHPGMVQPAALPVPPEQQQQVPQTFQMPVAVGTSNGNTVPMPQSGASTAQAAASAINETMPSVNKKVETKDADGAEANEDGDNKKGKESKALKMFKIALADFVKEALKPTWKEGQMSREVHKTIVKKVVDKVTSTVENTPPTKEKIDIYMSFSKDKLNKLVQAYVGKYATNTTKAATNTTKA